MKSLDFSFEMSPELCLSLNGKRLPFGCHAWYLPENYDFWKKYIKTDIIEDENICNYDKLQ